MGKSVDFDIRTILKEKIDIKEPAQYRVLLHNDDYTSMEFVIDILKGIFRMNESKAHRVMMNVHKQGIGICGVYTYDIALTKVEQVHSLARSQGFPLRASLEDEK